MNLNHIPLFDAHLHIIDSRFPLIANQGYLPPEFTCESYLERMRAYRLAGGAIVSGSFQAFDQSYLLEALRTLGPSFVGVTQLPATTSDEEIRSLDSAGVRALRFNLKRGGSEDVRELDHFARRVHDLVGWHVELYVDSRELSGLSETLVALPAMSIDHLGLSKVGLPILLKLAESGVRVKATGFGRVDFDIAAALRDLHAANPEGLMFGTDLPSTRAPRAYQDVDFLKVVDVLGEDAARAVLNENAIRLYRPRHS
jgi:predicted TIM-barrel fold metal-dependent hydrolase